MERFLIDYKVIELINRLQPYVIKNNNDKIKKIGFIYDDKIYPEDKYTDLNQIRCIYIETNSNKFRYLTEIKVLQKAFIIENEEVFIKTLDITDDYFENFNK